MVVKMQKKSVSGSHTIRFSKPCSSRLHLSTQTDEKQNVTYPIIFGYF
jgi:hypothetical protein